MPTSGSPAFFPVPSDWNGFRLPTGERVGSYGYGTLHARILLPPHPAARGNPWAIHVRTCGTASKLLIRDATGRLLAPPVTAGTVGRDRDTTRPSFERGYTTLDADASGEIHVYLQIANFEDRDAGPWWSPIFGTDRQLRARLNVRQQVDFAILGLLFVLGLHYLILFSVRRHELPILWFGLFCITVAVRSAVIGRYIEDAYPGIGGWGVRMKIEYIDLYLCVALFALFIRSLYPREIGAWFPRTTVALSAISSICMAVMPVVIGVQTLVPFRLLIVVVAVSVMVFLVRIVRRDPRAHGPILMAVGTLCLSAGAVNDVLRSMSVTKASYVSHFALVVFIFCHSLFISTMSHLKKGGVFGRYRIVRLLGRGGMGDVYEAYDTRLERSVALKLIPRATGAVGVAFMDPTAQLFHEARAAALLQHPNVMSIFDIGEENGVSFIAMECVQGTTLRRYVGDAEIPLATRVRWLMEIASALDAAHQRGIIHRDIKPENVMLDERNVVKVLDFGLARRGLGRHGDVAGTIIGSPPYMAPEQFIGQPLDPRADQFAWGVVAYELLTGKHPWRHCTDFAALTSSIILEAARPVRALDPRIPTDLETIVSRAMAKLPDERFPSMGVILRELSPAVEAPPVVGIAHVNEPATARGDIRTEALATVSTAALRTATTRTMNLSAATGADSRGVRWRKGFWSVAAAVGIWCVWVGFEWWQTVASR